jgi:hypothetical protein
VCSLSCFVHAWLCCGAHHCTGYHQFTITGGRASRSETFSICGDLRLPIPTVHLLEKLLKAFCQHQEGHLTVARKHQVWAMWISSASQEVATCCQAGQADSPSQSITTQASQHHLSSQSTRFSSDLHCLGYLVQLHTKIPTTCYTAAPSFLRKALISSGPPVNMIFPSFM